MECGSKLTDFSKHWSHFWLWHSTFYWFSSYFLNISSRWFEFLKCTLSVLNRTKFTYTCTTPVHSYLAKYLQVWHCEDVKFMELLCEELEKNQEQIRSDPFAWIALEFHQEGFKRNWIQEGWPQHQETIPWHHKGEAHLTTTRTPPSIPVLNVWFKVIILHLPS